jgi:hypothetical protein
MLCYERSVKNPAFQMEMSMFTKYPMVFTPPAMAAPMNPALSQNIQQQGPSSLETPNAVKQIDQEIKQQGAF